MRHPRHCHASCSNRTLRNLESDATLSATAIVLPFVGPLLFFALGVYATAGDVGAASPLPDPALQPPRIVSSPGEEFSKSNRGAQGVASIERAPGGRLWAAWYTGTARAGVESSRSYCVLATSANDGHTWTDVMLAIQTPWPVHTYDPCLWIDPQKRLWYFWAQSAAMQDGRMGVWAIVTDEPDAEIPNWSKPRRIANGIMLNKPTVLNNGHWLLPVGTWPDHDLPTISGSDEALKPYTRAMLSHDLGKERATNVFRSTDQGKTFELFGQARVPNTRHDEHMIVERRDGSLWMLLRNTRGIAQAISNDGGRTWTEGELFMAGGKVAGKRFFLRRLQSGAILLVRNDAPTGAARTHMTAFLSDDEGHTWTDGMLLDDRESSYPDGVQVPDGTIYIIYDHQRYTLNRRTGKEGIGGVMMATFREEDLRAGNPVTDKARLKVVISQLR